MGTVRYSYLDEYLLKHQQSLLRLSYELNTWSIEFTSLLFYFKSVGFTLIVKVQWPARIEEAPKIWQEKKMKKPNFSLSCNFFTLVLLLLLTKNFVYPLHTFRNLRPKAKKLIHHISGGPAEILFHQFFFLFSRPLFSSFEAHFVDVIIVLVPEMV